MKTPFLPKFHGTTVCTIQSNYFSTNPTYPFQRQVLQRYLLQTAAQSTCYTFPTRGFHTSRTDQGLEEFFGDPKLWSEIDIKSGREWLVEDLRLKDNETLHKLWYVLLKERNMLLTLEAEADRQKKHMPGDDRLEKVETSMKNLKQVVQERDEALNELQLGRKEKHPGKWEYSPFGFMHYVKPKEHLIPKHMSKYWAATQRQYHPSMGRFIRIWLEKVRKERWRRARIEYKRIQKLKERFPDSDMWEDDKQS